MLAHNGLGYDYPATERLYPWWKRPEKSWDTLVMAKVVWPYDALIGPDLARIRAERMPAHLLKAHSLKAWGYRTGMHKGEYKGGFDEWCPAMATYLIGDIDATGALCELIWKRVGWKGDPPPPGQLVWPELTFEVENEVARIILEQEWGGVTFNKPKAVKLAADLANEKARINAKLVEVFGSWWARGAIQTAARTTRRKLTEHPHVSLPRFSSKTGKPLKPYIGPPLEEISEGSQYVSIERVTFSPSSRDHLGLRLQEVYGWKPKKFGVNGKPTVDEGTLEEIPESVLPADVRKLIIDYFVVSKTLGTLNEGRKAWLKLADQTDDGKIHGQMDTCGAVTRRGTHKNPNLSGTPAVITEKGDDGVEHPVKGLDGRYGWECRELFCADPGEEQTGVDASALELIDLGHYLAPLDGGAFSQRVCDPSRDPHKEHGELAGLARKDAKTAIYLKVYGGSAYKLSLSLDITPDEVPQLLAYKGLPALLRSLEKRFDADFVRKLDDNQRAKIAKARIIIVKFDKGISGLKDLIEAVQAAAAAKGWLKAIDGSRIVVRKAHAALNSLLQSAGAISCKLWMVLFHREMARRGHPCGTTWRQILWVHDELQFSHKPGMGPLIKEVAEECLVQAGIMLGLKGRYRTNGKTGINWAQCH